MLSAVAEQTTAGQAAVFLILAMFALSLLVSALIALWATWLHISDLRAVRRYRRDRDARRKLERDLRASRPVGGVSRRYSN